MKINKSAKRNHIFYSWLMSYAIILIIPIAVSLIAYTMSIKTISEEVDKVHQSSLMQFKLFMDSKFSELNKINNEVIQNEEIKAFISLDNPLTLDQMYKVVRIQEQLKTLGNSNDFIKNICIYFKRSDFILTYTNIFRRDRFDEAGSLILGMSKDELFEMIEQTKYRDYKVVLPSDESLGMEKTIAVTQNIPGADLNNPLAVMIVVLDSNKIKQAMKNLTWTSEGDLLISNGEGDYISTADAAIWNEVIEKSQADDFENYTYKTLDGKKLTINSLDSDIIDWDYISMIPSDIYLNRVKYIKIIIIIYLLFCLFIGGAAAYLLARKNYNPIKKLILFFSKETNKPIEESDEFAYIENSMRTLFEENQNYEVKIKNQNEALKNIFLSRLYKGNIKDEYYIYDASESYGLNFREKNFIVSVIKINELIDFDMDERNTANAQGAELIYLVIRKKIEEAFAAKIMLAISEVDSLTVCMAYMDENSYDAQDIKAKMHEAFTEIIEIFSEKYGVMLSAALSNIHNNVLEIPKAYSEAVETIEYKMLMDIDERVADFGDIKPDDKVEFDDSYTLEKERQFINCIISGDFEGAKRKMNDMISLNFCDDVKSLQLAKCRMFGIINSMLNAIGEIKTTLDMDFLNSLDPINRLLKTNDVNELRKQMNFIFDQLNSYFVQKEKQAIPDSFSEILDYIQKHYANPELNSNSVCDKFDIHPSSLTKMFKKYIDSGVLNYIHGLRIKKAKALLKNTDKSIKEIAEDVGYLSSLTLIRVFRRLEGITPGRFKEID